MAVLLEIDGQRAEARVRRLSCDVESAGLPDDAGRLIDGEQRRSAAAGDRECAEHAERDNGHEDKEPSEHGLHRTSLLKSEVLIDEWRYRLGVRTRGSQPRDRGSIPRTATSTYR